MDEQDFPFNEAGRRLRAAMVSYIMGRAGVDRTLRDMPEDAGEEWRRLAHSLMDSVRERINAENRENEQLALERKRRAVESLDPKPNQPLQ